MTAAVKAVEATANENTSKLLKLLERAFYLASTRFPYWSVEFAALTPLIVELPKGHPERDNFTLGVTEGWVMLVSVRVIELGWSAQELSTVIAHELMHLWQRHAKRARAAGIDCSPGSHTAHLWNLACDMEINDDLRDAGCTFPKHPDGTDSGVFPESIGEPDYQLAEHYYAALVANTPPKPPVPLNGPGCGGGAGAKTQTEADLGLDGDPGSQGQGKGQEGDGDQEKGDKPPGQGGAADLQKTEDEMEALAERLDGGIESAMENGKLAGSIPHGMKLDAKRRRKKSVIDWKTQLRRAVRRAVNTVKGSKNVNWSRLSRRMLGGFPRPTHTDPVVKVSIFLDTSGSMISLIPQALREVHAVLTAARACVELFQVDADIAEVITLKTAADVDKVVPKGGGGTDFKPPFRAVMKQPRAKRPQVIVYITDGYGDAPRNPPPGIYTIWAMLGGTRAPAAWGETVLIREEAA